MDAPMTVSPRNIFEGIWLGTRVEMSLLRRHCALSVARNDSLKIARQCGRCAIADVSPLSSSGEIEELTREGVRAAKEVSVNLTRLRDCQSELVRQKGHNHPETTR